MSASHMIASMIWAISFASAHVLKNVPPGFESIYERKMAYKNGLEGDGFGSAVSIFKDTLIIGSSFNDELGEQAGAADLYEIDSSNSGWRYLCPLFVNHSEYDYFGWSVGLSNDWAIVGAWQDDEAESNSGAVYFFQSSEYYGNSVWNLTQKVTGTTENNYFGISVALDSNAKYALVGAPGSKLYDGENITGAGHVYYLKKSEWIEVAQLLPNDMSLVKGTDYYGTSTALTDLLALVGAYGYSTSNGMYAGAVYVYRQRQNQNQAHIWVYEITLIPSDSTVSMFFGRALSISIMNNQVAIGADGHDKYGVSSGAVYIFKRYASKIWSENQVLFPATGEDASYAYYGCAISMYNDSLIIGSPGINNGVGKNSGSAWYYRYNVMFDQWLYVTQIIPTDADTQDLFGSSVSLYENNIAIGAKLTDGYDVDSGAVYVYSDMYFNDDEVDASAITTVEWVLMSVSSVVLFFFLYYIVKSCRICHGNSDIKNYVSILFYVTAAHTTLLF